MSQSIRFLGLAIFAWVGVRAVSLGLVPGTSALAFDRPSTRPAVPDKPPSLPPIAPTPLPQIGAVAPAYDQPPGSAGATAYPYAAAYGWPPFMPYPAGPSVRYYIQAPVVRSAMQSAPAQSAPAWTAIAPMPQGRYFPETPVLDEYPTLRAAAAASRPVQNTPPLFQSPASAARFDRWQLSSWAMMREQPGPSSLASGGMLGGSQAGARLLWRFDPRLAVSVRTSTPMQSVQRGTEAALGLRYQPFTSIPVAVTAERRQWVGKSDGRSGFALFAEGGLYGRPLPFGARLDSYIQAGVVGPKERAWFVDGSATATRPLWRGLSAGVGVWGGAQKGEAEVGVSRLEAGPRLTLDLGRGLRTHADYRVKLVGNAEPGSGAVVTLAGDF